MKQNAAKAAAKAKTTSAPAKAPVAKKAAVKKSAPQKAVAARPAKPSAPARPSRVSAAPAVKIAKRSPKAQAAPASVTTTIVAAIDVGFGNHLTLRGAGPGLSWERGVPLECVAEDRWAITLPETAQPIVCKFLLNDTAWCAGDDYTVLPGSSVVLSPVF
ncbi:MAG: hypothetical protein RLZZ50_1335 [Verrucomicrobiota bacterium]|jgi:hypothetical protein